MRTKRKDNTAFYFIMILISSILLSVSGIWAIVEFILYLVKDNPFNWWSVGLSAVGLVSELFFFAKSALSD